MTIGSGIAIAGMWLAVAAIAFAPDGGFFLVIPAAYMALLGSEYIVDAQDTKEKKETRSA